MNIAKHVILFVLAILVATSAYSAPDRSITEATDLSAEKREQFLQIGTILNDWSGEYEKLETAGVMIDSFIRSEPNFLPAYVEKARLTIMLGATGSNDHIKANRDALNILFNLQKRQPAYAKPYILAGHAYLNLGDLNNAKRSLERAEKIGSADPWLYINWSDLYGRLKQHNKALINSRKALLLSIDNGKAMTSAIYLIGKYSKFSDNPSQDGDISNFVFKSFDDPEQRIRIASRLTKAYTGDQRVLQYAYQIIEKQGRETPERESVAMAMAEWLLTKGYRRTENYIEKYDPTFSSAAEKVLDAINPTDSSRDQIFSNKFSIALSDDDHYKAEVLLKNAEAGNVSPLTVSMAKAKMMWLKDDYTSVVAIITAAAENDPSLLGDALLIGAYDRLGRTDMLGAYLKMLVDKNPTSAWNQGNYAEFLLRRMNDIDGAIKYGDEALRLMKYPIAQNITALAYLMKASNLERSNVLDSKKYVRRAESIGFDDTFILENCENYCVNIRRLLKRP